MSSIKTYKSFEELKGTNCKHCGDILNLNEYWVIREKGDEKVMFHDWCYPKWLKKVKNN